MSVIKPSSHLRIFDIARRQPGRTISYPRMAAFLLTVASLLAAVPLTACTRSVSSEPYTTPTASQPIVISQVQVIDGKGIYISGSSTLPSSECVQTRLIEDGKAVTWWPEKVCIQPDAGQWEMLASLGREGSPAQLDPKHQYEIQAWWPKDEQKSLTRFPFNLQSPQQ